MSFTIFYDQVCHVKTGLTAASVAGPALKGITGTERSATKYLADQTIASKVSHQLGLQINVMI